MTVLGAAALVLVPHSTQDAEGKIEKKIKGKQHLKLTNKW